MEKEEVEKREKWKKLNIQEKKEEICKVDKKEELKRFAEVKKTKLEGLEGA